MSLFRKGRGAFKRAIAFALSFSIGVGAVASPVFADVGDGNSNDRISTYINLAANKSNMDDDLSGMSLTEDQLRFLGVYVSNFFVPFSTEFGAASSNDETDPTREAVINALQVGLNFSDTYAETFAETIVGLARSSVKELTLGVSEEYGENIQKVDDGLIPATYLNYFYSMVGGPERVASDGSKSTAIKEALVGYNEDYGDMKYGYWGWMDGTEFVPVSDFTLIPSTDGRTASMVAFGKCFESVPNLRGYGFSMFDLNSSEIEGGQEISGDLTKKESYEITMNGQRMMVDCFGDIIVYGLQHQVIAVPGCVNPYMWRAVASDGTDIAELHAGEAYQMTNIPSMAAADVGLSGDGNLYSAIQVSPLNTNTDSDGNTSNSGVSDSHIETFTLWTDNDDLGHRLNAYDFAGGSALREKNLASLKYILGYADDTPGSDYWTVEEEGGNITVSATVSAWLSLGMSKLDEDYQYQDQDKHDALEDAFDDLAEPWNSSSLTGGVDVPGASRDEVIDRIQQCIDAVEEQVANSPGEDVSQDTNPDTGNTNVRLKEMTPDMSTMFTEDGESLGNRVRIYRGTTDTNFDTVSNLTGVGNWLEAMDKSAEYSDEKYPNNLVSNLFTDAYDSQMDAGANYFTVTYPSPSNIAQKDVYVFDGMVMIDNLAEYHFKQSDQDIDYHTFNILNYANEDGTTANTSSSTYSWDYGSENTFAAGYTNIEDGIILGPDSVSESALVSLYCTYLFSSLYNSSPTDKANTIGKLGFRMNADQVPEIPSEPLELSDSAKSDLMLTSIRDWLYYLLHPVEGVNYVRELLTNKINGFLLGWHNDMLGTNGVGQTTGTTLYRSNTGYVTTPDLSEIEWTNSLINFYNQCIPFLLIVMIVTMVFAYITGILSLQKSIFGVAIFAIFLLLPVNLINGVVSISNRVSQGIYGEKFTYWALIQQETYASAIEDAANQDSYSNYLQTLYQTNNAIYSNQGSESIVLKWQAPKKMTSLMVSNDDSYNSLSNQGQELLNAFLGNQMTGESFVDDPESVYMYRSYLDISNYSRIIYRGISEGTQPRQGLSNSVTGNVKESLRDALNTIDLDYSTDRNNGYTNLDDGNSDVDMALRVTTPLSSAIVNDALGKAGTVDNLGIDGFVGINQNLFNFSLASFNTGNDISQDLLENLDNSGSSSAEVDALEDELARYSNQDLVGLAAYGLFSENVFYYFSWDLYDAGLEPSASVNSGYRNLLLGENNAGYFYNTKSNGELKDFMDMKSLFTYIIPYLKQCNDLVNEWDDVYGIFIYDGVPTEEGHWDDPDIQGNAEMEQRYWHNLNVARLYGLYTPWVDVMYDCSYADGEYINAMGERFYVSDPLDPATYPEERPMIFSESEMHEYGLGEGDLTKVERLILDCNRGMEERMYELLNYYNFSDVTLNTAAAMNCAFEFNNTFSENGIFSENHNIYPQSFELADFSYDAFLRFILSNTTGEEMNTTEDFYANIVENSSMTTVLVMLILDVLSMYVLPAFKIFFLIAIFLSALLIIVTTAFRVDPEQKFIKRLATGVFLPMIKFMVISIGFAYVISLFMGTGNNAVTQTEEISIQMGDPVVVMLAMCAINIIVLILYFSVIKKVVQDIKRNGKMSVNFMGGVFGGAAAMAVGAVGGSAFAGGSRGHRGYSGSDGTDGQDGTGVESERAQRRGSHNVDDASDVEEYVESTRKNDTKRDTVRMDQNTPKSKEQEKEKKEDLNEKTKQGMDRLNRNSEQSNEGSDSSRRRSSNAHKYTKSVKDPGSNRSKK